MSDPEYLGVPEAAAYCGIDRSTLLAHVRKGRLTPDLRVGSHSLFRQATLDAWKALPKGTWQRTPAKITEEQRKEIERRLKDGETQASLAREYGVTQSALSKMRTRAEPERKKDVSQVILPRYTQEQVEELREKIAKKVGEGASYRAIAETLGMSGTMAWRIHKGTYGQQAKPKPKKPIEPPTPTIAEPVAPPVEPETAAEVESKPAPLALPPILVLPSFPLGTYPEPAQEPVSERPKPLAETAKPMGVPTPAVIRRRVE